MLAHTHHNSWTYLWFVSSKDKYQRRIILLLKGLPDWNLCGTMYNCLPEWKLILSDSCFANLEQLFLTTDLAELKFGSSHLSSLPFCTPWYFTFSSPVCLPLLWWMRWMRWRRRRWWGWMEAACATWPQWVAGGLTLVRDVKSKKGWQTEKYKWGALRIGLSYSLHISLSEMPLAIYAGRSGGKPQSEMVAGFFHSWWAKMSRGWIGVYQVYPGGVPPLVVVLKGDLEARWVEEMVHNQIVDVDLDRLEIGRRRARMQVMYLGWWAGCSRLRSGPDT